MKIYLRIDLEPDETQVECECGDHIDIRLDQIQLIVGWCDICEASVAFPISDLSIIKEKN